MENFENIIPIESNEDLGDINTQEECSNKLKILKWRF